MVEMLVILINYVTLVCDYLMKPTISAFYSVRIAVVFCFTELTIKQEEETAEEAENRSPALEETGQTGEEGVALDESITGSPSNTQDGLSGPNMSADAGSRQPNGNDQCTSKCLEKSVMF